MQLDPIGIKDGLNRYAYVKNSPIMGVDPTGLYVDQMGNWYPGTEEEAGYAYNPLANPGTTAAMMIAPVAVAAGPGVAAAGIGSVRNAIVVREAYQLAKAPIESRALDMARAVPWKDAARWASQQRDLLRTEMRGNLNRFWNSIFRERPFNFEESWENLIMRGASSEQAARQIIHKAAQGSRQSVDKLMEAAKRYLAAGFVGTQADIEKKDEKISCTGSRIKREAC